MEIDVFTLLRKYTVSQ